MKLTDNSQGNYRFLTGIAPYSSGVAAFPGYEIVHATLRQPRPYRQGFELIERHLAAQDRPRQALCTIELRSPKPFTFAGFADFNEGYQNILEAWHLLVDDQNPVARTNVAPEVGPPDEPVLYAFSYTVLNDDPALTPTFVVAGAGDLVDGLLSAEAIVRPGETSVEAMQEKAAYVMGIMAARLAGLQVSWADVTCVDIYTVHPLHPYLASTILKVVGSAALRGVHWYYSRPPIFGLEFEMDVRGVRQEVWV
jgi:hypothetical protein